jgi:hypothetical protein
LTGEEETRQTRYFDVDRFRRIHLETSKPRGRAGRILNRVSNVFDSMQGFFIALMGLPIMFGTLGAVIIGSYYGPLAFLGIMGSIIGGFAFFVDRKVGQSLQFAEYNVLRRALATGIAFFVALGIIYLLLVLSRFHFF